MSAESVSRARWRHLLSGSTNRRIFSAAAIIGGLTFATKIVSMLREMMVASWFGTGDDIDAFLAGYVLPSYAMIVIAGSMNSALIPVLIETREKEGAPAAQRLFSSTLFISSALLIAAGLLMTVIAPFVLPLLFTGFSAAKLALATQLFHLFLPAILLTGLITNCEAALNAGERFALAALAPALVPIATMAGLALGGARWGVHALAGGMIAGFVLQLGALVWSLRTRGFSVIPHWHGFDAPIQRVVRQYLPAVASAALFGTSQLVDQSMAAMLPPGSIAALGYANRFVSLLLGVGTMALGTAVLPYFSQLAAASDWRGMRHTLRTYAGLIVLVCVPIVTAGILCSRFIVSLLFERGEFTATDTDRVAGIQAMYLLQIPFYTLNILFVRMVSALQANHILLYGTILSVVVNVTLNWVFMQWIGVAGIALSTSCVYVILSAFLGTILWNRLKRLAG